MTLSTDIFPHDPMEIAAQPASSSMAPRARSSQDENTRARWKKRERTPSWCATHWRLASIFLRLCSRNDFASPSASHPCAHAFQSTPPSTPFSLRRCSIPCLRRVTTFHFLVPRYLTTFYYSSSSRDVLSLFTRFRPRFYLLSKRSFQANLYFYESIKAYGLSITLIWFFSRRYLSLFVISMERPPFPI